MTARTWAVAVLAGMAFSVLTNRVAVAQPAAAQAKPAAVVNGEPIRFADVEAFLKAQGPTAVQLTEAQKRQARHEVLEMLMDDLLLTQFLRQNGPKVDPADVAKQLAELAASLKKENKTLADFLKETNQTEAQLRANVVKGLQWAGYVKGRLNDADVKRYYDENREFFDRVAVRCSHIVLRLPLTSNEPERQAARTKLVALRQEILAGKLDFAEAAK